MKYSAIVVAAGSGTRMKLGYNKAYYPLKDGRTILEWALSPFQIDADCTEIIAVTDGNLFEEHITNKDKVRVVEGGATREDSVYNGLCAVKEAYVMIHDGARPYITNALLEDLKCALKDYPAALLMVPSKDTVKVVKDNFVVKTLPRDTLMNAQTPQAFQTALLKECMQKAKREGFVATDDASIVENYSDARIKAVFGSYDNYKITTPEDIR